MLRDAVANTRASISVIGALAIPSVIGFCALPLESGNGLLRRVENPENRRYRGRRRCARLQRDRFSCYRQFSGGQPCFAERTAYLRHADKGTAAVEFALIAPALCLLLLGIVQFGLVLANYVTLTNAANVGAMQFAISRSDTTPYTDTVSAVKAAAPTLTPANLTITLAVNGTACSSDSACQTALTNAAPSSGGSLQPASVTVSYPCGPQWTWYNFWSTSCQLTSSMTEGVQ